MKRPSVILVSLLVCALVPSHAQSRRDIARLDSLIATSEGTAFREATLKKATLLRRMFCHDEAADVLMTLLEPESTDIEVLGELADCYYQAGRTDQAAELYSRLQNLAPDNLGFKVRYLNLAYRAELYPHVLQQGRAFLQKDTLAPVLSVMGNAFVQLEQLDSALVYFQDALRRQPRNALTVSKISDILLSRREFAEVLKLTDAFLEREPGNLTVSQIKGVALYLQGKYRESAQIFEKNIAAGDNSYGTHYYLGQNYSRLHLYYQADNHLTRAWEIDSTATTNVNLAVAIGNTHSQYLYGHEKYVAPWYERALDLLEPDPEQLANVYQDLASSEHKAELWDKAIEHYKEAYRLNPKLISCISNIAYCYEQKKDKRQAMDWYERYLKVGTPGSQGYQFVEESIRYLRGELFMEE